MTAGDGEAPAVIGTGTNATLPWGVTSAKRLLRVVFDPVRQRVTAARAAAGGLA